MAEPVTNVLGIVGIKHCGEYDATKNYEKLNVVTYNGSSYCAKISTTGNLPTNTDFWDLMAEKGDKGDKGDTGDDGYTPVKGTDYYTAADKAELETTLSSDVTTEVTSQLGSLTSATPLVASSTSGMTDTTRIYVNTTDGHWYWYNGSAWTDGGVYQATGIADGSVTLNKLDGGVLGNKYVVDGTTTSAGGIGIAFNIPEKFKFNEINKVKVVFDMKNESTTSADGTLYCSFINYSGSSGNYVNRSKNVTLPRKFNYYSDSSIKYHDTLEKDSIAFTDTEYVNRVYIHFYNIAGSYHFTMEDIKIYINDELIELNFNSSITLNALASQIPYDITFLASKKYLDETAETLNNRMDEIEEELPTEEVISLFRNYDNLTKSNPYSITCWGDSLTAARYPHDLGVLINNPNVHVNNKGHSGEASGTIAFRQGANKITTAEEITIPASNNEYVQFKYNVSTGFLPNIARIDCNCSISGIPGTLAYNYESNNWYLRFTRTENGEAVSVPSGTQLIYDGADEYNDDISIVWLGRNDISFSYPHIVDGVVSNNVGIVNNLAPTVKRFLLMGTINGPSSGIGTSAYNSIISINQQLERLYPYNYVDIRSYLVNDCIYDMGITPTAEDIQAMENDSPPPSIMNSDDVHLLEPTYTKVAEYLYKIMLSRGWIIK